MDITDIFGPNSARPDTPDFWKLSEIVLQLDAMAQDAVQAGNGVDINTVIAKYCDPSSVNYMAVQRVMRLAGVKDALDLGAKFQTVAALATAYLEGFTVANMLRDRREGQ